MNTAALSTWRLTFIIVLHLHGLYLHDSRMVFFFAQVFGNCEYLTISGNPGRNADGIPIYKPSSPPLSKPPQRSPPTRVAIWRIKQPLITKRLDWAALSRSSCTKQTKTKPCRGRLGHKHTSKHFNIPLLWPYRTQHHTKCPQNAPVSSPCPSRLAVIYMYESWTCRVPSIFSKTRAVQSRPLRRESRIDGLHCSMSIDRYPPRPALFYTAGIILSSKKWKNHQHQQRKDQAC